MSTAARSSKSNRQKQLARLERRLTSPRPDLPILRTSERTITPTSQQRGLAPTSSAVPVPFAVQRPGEGERSTTSLASPSQPTPTNPQPTPTQSPNPSPHLPSQSASSADRLPDPQTTSNDPLPEWTRLLPLPAGLPRVFRSFLYRYIEENHKPNNSHEAYLAAQIAQAMARKHMSALREPADQPNSLWLRYESLADRELKAAQREWRNHQNSRPSASSPPLPPREGRAGPSAFPLPPRAGGRPSCLLPPRGGGRVTPIPATNPQPTPQTQPNFTDPTFALKNPDDMTDAEALDELDIVLSQLTEHRRVASRS